MKLIMFSGGEGELILWDIRQDSPVSQTKTFPFRKLQYFNKEKVIAGLNDKVGAFDIRTG